MTMRATPSSVASARNTGSLRHRSCVRLGDGQGGGDAHGFRFPEYRGATGPELPVSLVVHIERVQRLALENGPPGHALPVDASRHQDLPLDPPEGLVVRSHPRPDGLECPEGKLPGAAALLVDE